MHKNREFIEAGIFNVKDSELNAYFGKRFEIFLKENFSDFSANMPLQEDGGMEAKRLTLLL